VPLVTDVAWRLTWSSFQERLHRGKQWQCACRHLSLTVRAQSKVLCLVHLSKPQETMIRDANFFWWKPYIYRGKPGGVMWLSRTLSTQWRCFYCLLVRTCCRKKCPQTKINTPSIPIYKACVHFVKKIDHKIRAIISRLFCTKLIVLDLY
jgi:hypothetical protein